MSTKILLADDHAMFRQGLRALIAKHEEFTIVGEASEGRAAVEMVHNTSPQIVVMDVHMPDLNGIDATRQILSADSHVRVIAVSASADEHLALEMFRAGALGYVLKDAAFDELLDAIRSVLRGQIYLSPPIANGLVANWLRDGKTSNGSVFESLSAREREVLQLIAEGKATKEVAVSLHVSAKTVEAHRRNLMGKLGIDNVAGLTKYAVREGVTTL